MRVEFFVVGLFLFVSTFKSGSTYMSQAALCAIVFSVFLVLLHGSFQLSYKLLKACWGNVFNFCLSHSW